MTTVVRKYVEGMKDANQLLDLLSADGSQEIEPTKAAAGRQVLYPDVNLLLNLYFWGFDNFPSTYLPRHYWPV